jgi:hypothetical protein
MSVDVYFENMKTARLAEPLSKGNAYERAA